MTCWNCDVQRTRWVGYFWMTRGVCDFEMTYWVGDIWMTRLMFSCIVELALEHGSTLLRGWKTLRPRIICTKRKIVCVRKCHICVLSPPLFVYIYACSLWWESESGSDVWDTNKQNRGSFSSFMNKAHIKDVQVCIPVYIYVCTNIYTYIHIYICRYIYIYIHIY